MQYAFEFCDGGTGRWRPERSERLFFGVRPNTEMADCLWQFAERFIEGLSLKERLLKRECLHISLHHVSDDRRLRTRTVHAAGLAANAVSMSWFEVKLRCLLGFATPPLPDGRLPSRPLVLLGEGEGLFELHRLLGAAMNKNGLRATGGFMPHMTLSFGSKPISMRAIEPIRLEVKEFALIHSELGLTRHNTIDRWPLAA
jgi:2'-5' RNA ligase